MADAGRAARRAADDIEDFLYELGFDRVAGTVFEETGRRLIAKRPIPPPSDHYPPQEFLARSCRFPVAITRFGPRKRRRIGQGAVKRNATGTLVILSRSSVWYRKRGIDDDTRIDLASFGIRLDTCTAAMIAAAKR